MARHRALRAAEIVELRRDAKRAFVRGLPLAAIRISLYLGALILAARLSAGYGLGAYTFAVVMTAVVMMRLLDGPRRAG